MPGAQVHKEVHPSQLSGFSSCARKVSDTTSSAMLSLRY